MIINKLAQERGFNNSRKVGAGFWHHSRTRKTGA